MLEGGDGLLNQGVPDDGDDNAHDERANPDRGARGHVLVQDVSQTETGGGDHRQKRRVRDERANQKVRDVSADARSLFANLGFGQLDLLPEQGASFIGQVFEQRADGLMIGATVALLMLRGA